MLLFARFSSGATPPSLWAASSFAVEKAMKMSPEPFEAMLPTLPRASVVRRMKRLSWCGRRGASVAATMMIEPSRP